jgi:hypothetical protein
MNKIFLPNFQKVNDRYVLIGDDYCAFKKLISECFKENNASKFEKLLNDYANSTLGKINFPYLCMAIYQNITLLYKETNKLPYEIFLPIMEKIYIKEKFHWEQLLTNKLTHRMQISKETWCHIELNLLLIQLKYSILFSKSKLIKPLVDLINNPLNAKDSYMPTMPQDSMFDIKNAILAGSRNEHPKFYACPNGHPYVLFDCGRPWVILNCKTCGAPIGGQNHVLLEGNKELNV